MLNRLLTLSTFYDLMSWVLLIIPMLQMRNLRLGELKGSAQGQYKVSILQLPWTTREVLIVAFKKQAVCICELLI